VCWRGVLAGVLETCWGVLAAMVPGDRKPPVQKTGPNSLTTEMGQNGTDGTHGWESGLLRPGEDHLGVHPEAAPRSTPGNRMAGLEPCGSGGLAPWLYFVET